MKAKLRFFIVVPCETCGWVGTHYFSDACLYTDTIRSAITENEYAEYDDVECEVSFECGNCAHTKHINSIYVEW